MLIDTIKKYIFFVKYKYKTGTLLPKNNKDELSEEKLLDIWESYFGKYDLNDFTKKWLSKLLHYNTMCYFEKEFDNEYHNYLNNIDHLIKFSEYTNSLNLVKIIPSKNSCVQIPSLSYIVDSKNSINLKVCSKFVQTATINDKFTVSNKFIQDCNKFNLDLKNFIKNEYLKNFSNKITDKILENLFALGWTSCKKLETEDGLSLNFTLNSTDVEPTTQTYIDNDGNPITCTIPGYVKNLEYENISSIQNRFKRNIILATNYIINKNNKNIPSFIVTNSAIADAILGTPGEHFKIKENQPRLLLCGKINDMDIYIDRFMDYNDNRILLGCNSNEKSGLYFLPKNILNIYNNVVYNSDTSEYDFYNNLEYALLPLGDNPENNYFTIHVKF